MAYTTHGHHISGSPKGNEPEKKELCGGPVFCHQCSTESIAWRDNFAKNFSTPQLTHTDETMQKVYKALREVGLNDDHINDAVMKMQNAGILFREAVK